MAKYLSCVTLLFIAFCLNAQRASADSKKTFAEVYRLYSNGAYAQAVEDLTALNSAALSRDEKIAIAYWKGLCFSKMQSFDKAVVSLQEAAHLGADHTDYKDLQYELGQALYASQSLRPALEAFEKSVKNNYKIGPSLYYKGFINQILEDHSVAISTYKAILRLPDDPDKVKEGSLLQIAELELNTAMAEKNLAKRKVRITKRVIPAFQDVIAFVDSGPAADEARRSLAALLPPDPYGNGPKFQNGTPIPTHLWAIRAIQDLKYDSNVIFQANNALIQISNTGSMVAKTDVDARYDFIFNRRYVVSPEVDVYYNHNFNQTESTVFSNDMFSVTSYLRSRFEHTVGSAPSAMSFDVEYNYSLRDYLSQHALPYYSSYINFTYGNRVQLIPIGSTSLNLSNKWFYSVIPGQTATNPAAVLSQNFNLGKTALTESFAYDFNFASNPNYNRSDYRISSALNIPEAILKSSLSIAFDFTFVDTQNQYSTRGLEKTISPSLTLTRSFQSGASASFYYSYITNISLDTVTYSYSKNTIGVNFAYRM
jgi:tetratricopeptide (TPR) repeat protein